MGEWRQMVTAWAAANPLLWAGCALLCGILVTLLLGWLCWAAARRRRKKKQISGEIAIDVGKLHQQGAREYQQDSFSVSDAAQIPERGLLAVIADGMGGLEDGDRISQCAVSTMMEQFHRVTGDPMGLLLSLVENANQAVNKLLGEGNYYKSGSTLVAGLIREGKFYYVSIGDSRICLLRDGDLYQLNREHIYRQELLVRAVNREIGWEQALSNPKAQGLTSFLGMGTLKYIDIPAEPVEVRPGDRFVLMSDGVYNALTRQELLEEFSKSPDEAAEGLRNIIENKKLPGQDNYTAIILSCRGLTS